MIAAVVLLAAVEYLTIPAPLTAQLRATPECGGDRPIPLDLVRPWTGALAPGESQCLAVTVEAGALVRAMARVEMESLQAGISIALYAPGDSTPALRISLGDSVRHPLSWEAITDGPHVLVVRTDWAFPDSVAPGPITVWLDAIEPPALVRARRDALARDPRLESLARTALSVRSLSPEDEDFRDLAPLRDALAGVRVVLLGEATHGSGSDFLARSRLVRFLHREMGFDVLAFEAGMYGMAVAWDSLRAGMRGRDALELGAWRMWSRAVEMQPLIEYVRGESAGGRPLELAGFDNQFMPHGASVGFVEDLARILESRRIGGPLVGAVTAERRALESMSLMRFRRGEVPLPTARIRRALVRALEDASSDLAHPGDDAEARLWSELLRGTACHARRVWADEAGDSHALPERCLRDRQMARHLVWLANERFPGRKIIAWAANGHVIRTDEVVPAAGSGPSLGQGVWEALGEESFVIATTSHRGTYGLAGAPDPQHIVTDQHSLPELEELMEAAGFEHALVDLRRAKTEGSWLAGPFLARPVGYLVEERVWSGALDAIFFIRDQSQPGRVREP